MARIVLQIIRFISLCVLALVPTAVLATSPNITILSPRSAAVGGVVTITGTDFGDLQGSSTVAFNGTVAVPTSWSANSITVPVPSGATTGNVVVTAGGQISNGFAFTVVIPASLTYSDEQAIVINHNKANRSLVGCFAIYRNSNTAIGQTSIF